MMSWRGRVHKTYALDKCPFYKFPAPHVLSRLLNVNVKRFKRGSDLYLKYYKREVAKNWGGIRKTETPFGELRRIHERIFNLLKRISVPQFLHSGIKGRSYVSNARSHTMSHDCFCLDIEKFFPSTIRGHGYGFLKTKHSAKRMLLRIWQIFVRWIGICPRGVLRVLLFRISFIPRRLIN